MSCSIVWAKFPPCIYWPAKIVEDTNDKLVYFFDEDTWSLLSRRIILSDWDCTSKDLFIKKGNQLGDISRRLSFSRAVKMAEDDHQAMTATNKKGKKGRKRKIDTAVEETTTTTETTQIKVTTTKTKTDHVDQQLKTPEKKKRGRSKKPRALNGDSKDSIINDSIINYDDDEDDLPAAFSPVQKTPDSFLQGDVIWARYRSCPYYPAVFHSWFSGKKKLQHAWVYFFDESWQIKEMKRTILRIPFRNILHFCCDQEKKDTIMREGKSYNSQDFEGGQFAKAIKCAEEYLTSKAAGKMDEFFECEAEEEFSDDDDEVCTRLVKLSNGATTSTPEQDQVLFKDLLSKRSKRTSSSSKTIKDLLNAIDNTRPTLVKIYNGAIESERHKIFTSGTTNQKNNLKYQSGYGPIDDDRMAEELSDKLLNWFKESCKKRENINAVSYVNDVWLPEAIILALMNSKKITRNKAEKIYFAR